MKQHNICAWVGKEPLMLAYHEDEWGVPTTDDRVFFEHIVLDTFQAGLSWTIIMKKRARFKEALDNFDPSLIAQYDESKLEELILDEGMIRNRRKFEATINNAQRFLEIQKEFGSFTKFIWSFVDNKPIVNQWQQPEEVPAFSDASTALSKELKKRGMIFMGPTTCYAIMQATGLINDHLVGCHRHPILADMALKFKLP
ncbi:MAG: DNA-3-methyladenine glycosylase I [Candidatus Cloacimonetes bacterium]|nr:DNA-3-methyladenine glycosylase I [Candidatus Cloacimonadota bacterium]